jgi:N-acetylmuramic acid 6-phosphate (MurNAc-6-P) etherase
MQRTMPLKLERFTRNKDACRYASGTITYGGLEACNKIIYQVFPVMQATLSQTAFPIDVVVGPEFVTGSSE